MARSKQRLCAMAIRAKQAKTLSQASGSLATRLRLGSYIADIVSNTKGSVFHWIVQKAGSPKVLGLGQEASFAAALEQGQRSLEVLVQQERFRKRRAIYAFSNSAYC